MFTNLNLNLAKRAKSSHDAGNYVCNFSMYVMLDYIKRRKLPTLYGFIHVPHGYNVRRALTVLQRALVSSRFDSLLSKLAITETANTDYDSRKGAKGAKFGLG